MSSIETYNGVEISLSGTVFTATIDGHHQRAPSVAAMRKRIDAAKVKAFKPFDGLMLAWAGGYGSSRKEVKIKTVSVIGVERGRRVNRYGGGDASLLLKTGGSTVPGRVYPVSALKALTAYANQYNKIEAAYFRDSKDCAEMLKPVQTVAVE